MDHFNPVKAFTCGPRVWLGPRAWLAYTGCGFNPQHWCGVSECSSKSLNIYISLSPSYNGSCDSSSLNESPCPSPWLLLWPHFCHPFSPLQPHWPLRILGTFLASRCSGAWLNPLECFPPPMSVPRTDLPQHPVQDGGLSAPPNQCPKYPENVHTPTVRVLTVRDRIIFLKKCGRDK